ncbi:MAG: hypothetical protein MK098_00415 [Marinovum sp.]|nr:hypothetical protein [Marinovum sp.]
MAEDNFLSGIFKGSALGHLIGFVITNLMIWVTVWLLASHYQDVLSQPNTPGREFATFIEGSFLVLLGSYILGGFGAATRMHAEGIWAMRKGGPDPSVVAFSRMTLGCVFGLLTYLALSEGLLDLFVSQTNLPDGVTLEPTYVSILLFSMLAGMFASEVFRGLKARLPKDQPPQPPSA